MFVVKFSELLLSQKFRYLLIGSYNTVIGYLLFVLIFYYFSATINHSFLLCISHLIATTHNFFSYRFFVFKVKSISLKNYFKFNLVYLLTFIINLATFIILTKIMNWNLYLSQALIVTLIVVLSYILNKYYSFSNKPIFKEEKK